MDVPQTFFSVEVFPDKFGMFICLTDGCALWVSQSSNISGVRIQIPHYYFGGTGGRRDSYCILDPCFLVAVGGSICICCMVLFRTRTSDVYICPLYQQDIVILGTNLQLLMKKSLPMDLNLFLFKMQL